MKLLSLYAAKKYLGDSVIALKYRETKDSLYIRGTGDPSFLHPLLSPDCTVYNFLKNATKPIVYIPAYVNHFGSGWSWDDFPYKISTENSAMPIFGNYISFSTKNKIKSNIPFFDDKLEISKEAKPKIKREENQNIFRYNPKHKLRKKEYQIPFIYDDNLFVTLLSDTLKKEIVLGQEIITDSNAYEILYSMKSDSLYKFMMQESDNFMAEQILLMCSDKKLKHFSTKEIIKLSKNELLRKLPDEAVWVDGSGLSRYNLNTPRNIIQLYQLLEAEFGRKKLMEMLAHSGEAGTLDTFLENKKGLIIGKTGTLKNNFSLSGYIKAKNNKWYLFSFMNNNYTTPSPELKNEMERTLMWIHNKLNK